MGICFFIGHRESGDELLPALTEAVERHITEYGITSFMVGRYGNFDKLAARVVIDEKKRHPEVTLTLLLPYHPLTDLSLRQKALTAPFIHRVWRLCRNEWPSCGPTVI